MLFITPVMNGFCWIEDVVRSRGDSQLLDVLDPPVSYKTLCHTRLFLGFSSKKRERVVDALCAANPSETKPQTLRQSILGQYCIVHSESSR